MIDPLDYNETYWEGVAQTRWGRYMSEVEKKTILAAHGMFGSPTTALEVGCEGGRWSTMLAELGWEMTCTDINPAALEICRRRIPSAKILLVNPDDREVPCESGSVDLLLCVEGDVVLQQDWILPEAFRVLRSGGLMVCVIWNQFSWRGVVGHWVNSGTKGKDYYQFSYPAWRRRFRRAGFTWVYQEGFCWFPFGRSSDSRLVPFFTELERFSGLRKLFFFSPWISLIARKTA